MGKRVAFVVQRYGIEVNGGAELLCRVLAEHMQKHWDVVVLTSCAREYVLRFENDYREGVEVVNGVKVIRFKIDYLRSDASIFSRLDQKVLQRIATEDEEQLWLKEIGPYSSEMLRYVADHHAEYELFVFFTYLYATTTLILPIVREKAVLVPNAHDESPIHARFFDNFFSIPKMLVLNTDSEKKFLEARSQSSLPHSLVAGVGFEQPAVNARLFKDLYHIDNYFIYAGRIQKEKCCDLLFQHYLSLPKKFRKSFPLLLLGKSAMDIPNDKSIIHIGFVSDEIKNSAIAGATALIMPSAYESLSMVIMESWLCGTPVLVNAESEVLKTHCDLSGGGLSFKNFEEFSNALLWFSNPRNKKEIDDLISNGKNYVESKYSWKMVETKYLDVFDQIIKQGNRKRVAFVVQRCGREVNGGAEAHCLVIAKHMAAHWHTEVLTTCALDYADWANHYLPGVEAIGGTIVRRFQVALPRETEAFNRLSSQLRPRSATASLEEQEAWMRAQGPWSPELFEFIEAHASDYDAFIFYTYLYAPTWFGLPKVAEKAILAPLAHDEWTIYLNMWDRFFTLPRSFIFNTIEERDLLRRRFPDARLEGPVAGVVIDCPSDIDPLRFRREHGIDEGFLLYVGRIDPSKGCQDLFDYFTRHRASGLGPGKLVLLGKPVMPIPDHPDIISLGFVSEQTKWNALAACDALVMPSPYESLSMVLLEAWSVGKPVIVNGRCEVLVGQCRRANGGVWYENFEEFSRGVACLQEGRNPGVLGRQGWRFVKKNYSWPVIEPTYLDAVNAVVSDDVSDYQ